VELVRQSGHTEGDVALALLFYGGLAAGVLVTGLAGQSAARLQEYLFGSILTISGTDVVVTLVLALVIVLVVLGLLPQLFAVAQDQEFAQVAGLPVRTYSLLVSVLAAVTVTVAMRTVGLLLVSALMVVPVATAQQLTRSFGSTLRLAMLLGAGASLGGLLASAYLSLQFDARISPGPSIVLLSLAGFALVWPLGALARRRRRLLTPFAAVPPADHTVSEEHGHVHGPDCGHLAVPHGDHVDYLHDGQRHAEHGSHYDEH
jgi:zinc transport system permease protein